MNTAGLTRVKVRQIIGAVIEREDFSLEEFLSPSRARFIAWPRQRSMYLCRILTNLSLPAIGRRHGGRDHTTVLHAIRRVEARIAADPSEAAEVSRMIAMFSVCPVFTLVAQVRTEMEALVA